MPPPPPTVTVCVVFRVLLMTKFLYMKCVNIQGHYDRNVSVQPCPNTSVGLSPNEEFTAYGQGAPTRKNEDRSTVMQPGHFGCFILLWGGVA